MKLQELKNINISGKKVFIRCDFNVPVDEYQNITDPWINDNRTN
jgi:phosphoglycerate kinase